MAMTRPLPTAPLCRQPPN